MKNSLLFTAILLSSLIVSSCGSAPGVSNPLSGVSGVPGSSTSSTSGTSSTGSSGGTGGSTGSTGSSTTSLSAPSNVKAAAGNAQAVISWTAPSGTVSSYNLYYRTSPGVTVGGAGVTKRAGVTSGTAITGLTNMHKYYFVVTAQNSHGESAISNEAGAMPGLIGGNVQKALALTGTVETLTTADNDCVIMGTDGTSLFARCADSTSVWIDQINIATHTTTRLSSLFNDWLTTDGINLYGSVGGDIYKREIATGIETYVGSWPYWSNTSGFTLTTDGSNIYALMGSGNISQMDIATGTVTQLVTSTSTEDIQWLTTDGTNLYYFWVPFGGSTGKYAKVVIATGQVTTYTVSGATFSGLKLGTITDGTSLYVVTAPHSGGSYLHKINIATGNATLLVDYSTMLSTAVGMATDGTSIYTANTYKALSSDILYIRVIR